MEINTSCVTDQETDRSWHSSKWAGAANAGTYRSFTQLLNRACASRLLERPIAEPGNYKTGSRAILDLAVDCGRIRADDQKARAARHRDIEMLSVHQLRI
jgi:hypothetical protein